MDKKHRNLTRWLKRGLSAVFLLAVVAMVVVAWMPKPVPVETAAVTRGELVVTVDEDGRTRVKDRYVISAPLAGNLARIELHPGDEVEEGGVLARIVPLEAPLTDTPQQRSLVRKMPVRRGMTDTRRPGDGTQAELSRPLLGQ